MPDPHLQDPRRAGSRCPAGERSGRDAPVLRGVAHDVLAAGLGPRVGEAVDRLRADGDVHRRLSPAELAADVEALGAALLRRLADPCAPAADAAEAVTAVARRRAEQH
ncbi:hypothetical protein, partial [Blastococcus sp. CCUG 61487]|uniref:hypothetical protein n=1 Tax=Blastococcus sp. CCUG 61487 TaxID=1840703 RepID=UPI001BAED31F